eukprot:jgi/Orpsp1_1/1192245/evm.model.d7180000091688.1
MYGEQDQYLQNVLALQFLIDNTIIESLKNNSTSNIDNNIDFNIDYKPMDKRRNTVEVRSQGDHQLFCYCLLFYFIPCIFNLLNNLVSEKESKVKESLVIMGVKKSSFWISWAVIYGISILITSLLTSVIIYFSVNYLEFCNTLITIVVVLIYGISCCCMVFFISTFVSNSKTANTVSILITVSFFIMVMLNKSLDDDNLTLHNIFNYVLSPVSMDNILTFIFKMEDQKVQKVQKVYIDDLFAFEELKEGFLGLITSTIIYISLAIYLDNVLPQGNNLHREWYFILTDILSFFKSDKGYNPNLSKIFSTSNEDINSKKNNNKYIQNDPQNLEKIVEVKNIYKMFNVKGETIEALHNIEFNGYNNEIFAILGHNGAGKTTLINIMTGILKASK